ncbi:MAG TPA: hypothetical protein VKR06_19960 [Ktedonosporobacter sp.]|nr:hypothetical protein [Ktedonosporobacter sp.]
MATNGITAHKPGRTTEPRRRIYVSGLVVRVAIALVISWLIIMAFFVSGVTSR